MKTNHPLLKIAQSQSGLFTSWQAIESGIDSRNHSYHLKSGNWSRVGRGIYQLNLIQENNKKDFFFFQLWSKTRDNKQVGTFSYETALHLIGLETDIPTKFHITVPIHFRRNTEVPHKLILHYENLKTADQIKKDNLIITSIKKTFQDLILSRSYSAEWIKKHLKKAMNKKIISLEEIKGIPVTDELKRVFSAILFELS